MQFLHLTVEKYLLKKLIYYKKENINETMVALKETHKKSHNLFRYFSSFNQFYDLTNNESFLLYITGNEKSTDRWHTEDTQNQHQSLWGRRRKTKSFGNIRGK